MPWCPGKGLLEAVRDYRFLLDRGYPVQATIKLVGDRFRLDKAERVVLFWGVLDQGASARIAGRTLVELPQRASLCIDGYNVLFTLANYRAGRPLFVSTDGLLRDAGGSHGRFASGEAFNEAAGLLVDELSHRDLAGLAVYLDAPVSSSGDHAAVLRAGFSCPDASFRTRMEVVPSADGFVKEFEGDAVASSDSAIAINSRAPVFDLARSILERRFHACFPDLRKQVEPASPVLYWHHA